MSDPAPSYLFLGYKFRVLDAVDPIGSNLFSALSVAVFCYVRRTVDRYRCSPQLNVPWMFIAHSEVPVMSRWLMGLSLYSIAYRDFWQRHSWAFWFYRRRLNNYKFYPVWGSRYSGVWRRASRKLDPDYTLTRHRIPEELNPALHRCENLKKKDFFIGSVYCRKRAVNSNSFFRIMEEGTNS